MTAQAPRKLARIAAATVFLVSVFVCLGWTFEITAFKSVVPGWPKVAPITLSGFVLGALSLWCAAALDNRQKPLLQRISMLAAIAVALIGGFELLAHLSESNPGIDLLGFREVLALGEAPVRMAPATALALLLLGGALIASSHPRSFALFQVLTLLSGLVGWLGFAHYIYGGQPLWQYTSMSAITAVVVLLLSLGTFCLRAEAGLLALLASNSAGGLLLRQLLPPALIVPFFLGWLRLKAQQAGWFGTEAGLSLFALSNVLLFAALVWATAILLNRTDARRRATDERIADSVREVVEQRARTEAIVRESEARFTSAFRSSPAAIAINRRSDLINLEVNDAFLRLFECQREEIIGHTLLELGLLDQATVHSLRQRLDATGAVDNIELVAHSRRGRLLHIQLSVRVIQVAGESCGLSTVVDITESKRAEQALRASEEYFRFLNGLTEATRTLSGSEQIMAVTARMLGEHIGASRCAYAEVEPNGERFTILHDYTDGCASTVGNYQLSLFGPRAVSTLGRGETLIIRNVAEELVPAEGADVFIAMGIQAIITCPLIKDGVLRAMMAVHQTAPRDWQPSEITMVREVVERCWATIERGAAESEQRRSANLLRIAGRAAHLGGWAVDLPEVRVSWSDEVCAIHGVPSGTVPDIEQAMAFFVPGSREVIRQAFAACVAEGTPFDLELELITAQGALVWVRTIGEAQRNPVSGIIARVHGAFKEITERKHAQDEIRQLNTELERRVAERTAQLEAVNHELEAFSHSVSHDLRAPLRGVDGYVRMLQEDYGDRLDAEGHRLIGVVSSEAKRMGRLIDDLLAFSRMGRQRMQHTSIDMSALAQSVFDRICAGIAIAPRFELRPLPPASGDLAMLRQVFVNLLDNAVKFSAGRDHPMVEVGSISSGLPEPATRETTYYVKDNGAGFDEKYRDKLFGVFQRLHSESEFEGTGVGLALVQRIIHRHGGKVWAHGQVGSGAAFYFSLPQVTEFTDEQSKRN